MDGHRRTLAFVGFALTLAAAFYVGTRYELLADNVGCVSGDVCGAPAEFRAALGAASVALFAFMLGAWALVVAAYPREPTA